MNPLNSIRRWISVGMLAGALVLAACADHHNGSASGTTPTPVAPAASASFTMSASSIVAGNAVAFDARASTSPTGATLNYAWDFGDGVRGGGVQIAHLYAAAGTYTAKLTVLDSQGAIASATQSLTATAGAAPGAAATVTGLIDDGKAALAGVSVALVGGNASTTSDADGRFSLSLPTGVSNMLRLTKTGYADQFVPVPLGSGVPSATINAAMLAREAAQTLDATAGGTLSGKHGAALTLTGASLIDANGAAVSGPTQISLTPVDIRGGGVAQFPGSFRGIQSDGTSTAIVSYGSTEFVLAANGQRLNLKPGSTAQIDLPLYAQKNLNGSTVAAGDRIPLWSLDEKSGQWVQEGTGLIVASSASPSGFVMRATVSHFTWWNIDGSLPPDPVPYRPQLRCVRNDGPGQPLVPVNCQVGTRPRPGQAPPPAGAVVPAYEERISVTAAGVITTPGNIRTLGMPPNVTFALYACSTDSGIVACGMRTVNGAPGVSEAVVIELARATACASAPAVSSPASLTASLAAMDVACYDLAVAAPTRLSISASAVGDPNLSILGTKSLRAANGTVIASADWRVGDSTDLVPLVVNVPAGNYRLEVATSEAQPSQVHLLVADVSCSSSTTPAMPATLNLALPGLRTACLQLPAQAANRRIVVSVQGPDANASGTVSIHAGNGDLLTSQAWHGTVPVAITRDTVADNYSVELFNANAGSSSATVNLRSVDLLAALDCSRSLASPGTLGVALGPIDVACASITIPAATTLTLRATTADGSGLTGTKTLKASNGTVLATTAWTGAAADSTPLTAVVNAGTYRLELANNSAYSGAATLAASSVVTGCASPEVISSPTTRNVSLAGQGVACYSITVPNAKKLSIAMQSPASGVLSGNIVLKDSNSAVVASKAISGLTTLAQRLLAGTYRLELTNGGNGALSFVIALSDVDIPVTSVALPSVTPLSVPFQGSQGLSFTPVAGTNYIVTEDLNFSFITPSGVASNAGTTVSYTSVLLNPPTADPQTLIFGSDATIISGGHVKVIAAPTLPIGVPQVTAVNAANDVNVKQYVLNGQAGDTISVAARTANGAGPFPSIHMFDSSGAELNVFQGVNPFRVGADMIAVALPTTGAYRVDVLSASNSDIPNITLAAALLPAPQLLPLAGETTTAAGSIAQLGDTVGYAVDLVAGDLISVAVDTVASPRLIPGLYFRQPVASGSAYFGQAVYGASTAAGQGVNGFPLTLGFQNSATFTSKPLAATSTGRYLIHLRGTGNANAFDPNGATGPYTLRVFKPAARSLSLGVVDSFAGTTIGFTHYSFNVATAGDYRVCSTSPNGAVLTGLFDATGQAQTGTVSGGSTQAVYTLAVGTYHLTAVGNNLNTVWQTAATPIASPCF